MPTGTIEAERSPRSGRLLRGSRSAPLQGTRPALSPPPARGTHGTAPGTPTGHAAPLQAFRAESAGPRPTAAEGWAPQNSACAPPHPPQTPSPCPPSGCQHRPRYQAGVAARGPRCPSPLCLQGVPAAPFAPPPPGGGHPCGRGPVPARGRAVTEAPQAQGHTCWRPSRADGDGPAAPGIAAPVWGGGGRGDPNTPPG